MVATTSVGKTLLSALLLLSVFPFSSVEGEQNLRRNVRDRCTPDPPTRRSEEDSFVFVLLEFEKNNLNDLFVPFVNGTLFVETYNSLVSCSQLGAFRSIDNATEFMPQAFFLGESKTGPPPTTLLRIERLECNSCGLERYLFKDAEGADEDTVDDYNVPNLCNCDGPATQDFVDALRSTIPGLSDIKNATQIRLINPEDCEQFSRTTYSYDGVCPGLANKEFSFFSSTPSDAPSVAPTHAPTDDPTRKPTHKPTRKPSHRPTRGPTHEPTLSPTRGPTHEPTLSPTRGPTASPTDTATEAPTEVPTIAPTESATDIPTIAPAASATNVPTIAPTVSATNLPTIAPTVSATEEPTERQTETPTRAPTEAPDDPQTEVPTPEPTATPRTEGPTIVRIEVAAGNSTRSLAWNKDGLDTTQNQIRPKKRLMMKLGWDEEDLANIKEEIEMKNPEPFATNPEGGNICQGVDAKLVNNAANREMCRDYLDLPLTKQDESVCASSSSIGAIPKVLYTVSRDNQPSQTQAGISKSNPGYKHRHFGDAEASDFVREHCGEDAAHAYQCLAPPAFRADIFRFCALWSQGGLYLDSDMLPLVPLEDLYDPCAVATIGHDWPQGKPQKQMKILAGKPGAPIFRCMIDTVVGNVRSRYYPESSLGLTGPMVLHDCYEKHPEGVSVTYHDTRDAAYPYSGMRAGEDLLAFEVPAAKSRSIRNYRIDFEEHEVYRSECPLHKKKKHKVRRSNVTGRPIETKVPPRDVTRINGSPQRRLHETHTLY